ncbi:NAD(P)-dependent oxidoreductase [Phytoactinopolyspora halotolerans]|uniref:NAD(P)-dependent oxidoreductase n=1 Tax=Phytoactinopolyspora halotolerans TaxID=1981512 RepID=A0A6L9S0P9_9ACTN|nr:NAD(P)-dependent oxidoreductase [Phytoactinopolyspora halotolerans]NED98566.1 NAD(P)-dependent oxidoreductase [Phytoactinopolyspora halotolerans]
MTSVLDPGRAHIGFVGLGNLGQPMARALCAGGWSVTVLDAVPSKVEPVLADGATAASGPLDLHGCDAVSIAVSHDAAVESVLVDGGLLTGLAPGSSVIVHSTVLPSSARRLAGLAAEREIAFLDAPVSGGDERALRGELTLMAGAELEHLARARPLLDTVASEIHHLGPPGAGAATKLANQLMMFASLLGVHEALDLATAYGVGERAILDATATSTGDSWAARSWGFFDRVAAAYDRGGTRVEDRPWRKDLVEILQAARGAGLDLPLATLLSDVMADRVEVHARSSAQPRGPTIAGSDGPDRYRKE